MKRYLITIDYNPFVVETNKNKIIKCYSVSDNREYKIEELKEDIVKKIKEKIYEKK